MERFKNKITQISRTHLIPLLFTIAIVIGISSYYNYEQLYLYIPLTFLVVPALFELFDYTAKHKFKGGAIIFLLLCVSVMLMIVFHALGQALYADRTKDHFYFVIWFLTPKEVLDYNPYYAAIAYTCYLLFISVTSYYFTRIQYRIIVTAMIAFFPILTYGKDDSMIPLWVGIPLLALYFGVMIYSRQLIRPIPKHSLKIRFTPKQTNDKPAWDVQIWKSVLFYLVLGTVVCMAAPKPSIMADRTAIDSALKMSGLTDYLMNAISDFTDSSDGGGSFNGSGSDRVFAYVNAEETLALKTRTFTHYSFDNDTWFIGDFDQKFVDDSNWQQSCQLNDINKLLDILEKISVQSPEFAQRYALTELTALKDTPLPTRYVEVQPATGSIPYLLSPAAIQSVYAPAYEAIGCTYTGTVYNHEQAYSITLEDYTFGYQTPFTMESERLNYLLETSEARDWFEMLTELNVLAAQFCTADECAVVSYYFSEADRAQKYNDECGPVKSERIAALAEELVQDCSNQTEQVAALAYYFDNGTFVYDLEYAEPHDANAETFLFESKRGVCYEFATAMVLMCRSVGIPARYVEGNSVSEPSGANRYDFEVRYLDSHAYVEVYLDGFGWCSVDPTIADYSSGSRSFFKRNQLAEFIGVVLLVTAAIMTALYLLLARRVSELIFRLRIKRMPQEKAVAKMLIRLRDQAQLSDALTAEELKYALEKITCTDMTDLINWFSAAIYGGQTISEQQFERCYSLYRTARDIIYKEKKREQKEFRKRGFKTRIP